jgi:hypothetical protein
MGDGPAGRPAGRFDQVDRISGDALRLGTTHQIFASFREIDVCHMISQLLRSQLLLLLLLLLSSRALYAQPCGWTGLNAFVLDIHTRDGEKIERLKIYLVDELGRPYFSETWISGRDGPFSHIRRDTILFWENKEKQERDRSSSPPLNRYCQGAGDNYLVFIYQFPDYPVDPYHAPVYQARIVDVDGEKNGGYFPTRTVRLDYGRSVNLCHSDIMDQSPGSEMVCEDGKPFVPIAVILDKPPLRMETGPVEALLYHPQFDTIRSPGTGEDSLYAIRSVMVQDYATLNVLQTVAISHPFYRPARFQKGFIEYGDFYFDNPDGIRDFRVQTDRLQDSLGYFSEKYLHYVFQPDKGRFELDTLLSNYYLVEILENQKIIRRYEKEFREATYLIRTFILADGAWQLVSERAYPRPDYTPPKTTHCLVWVGDSLHRREAVFPESDLLDWVEIRDTFSFINTCADTLFLDRGNTAYPNTFSWTQRVPPGDTGLVYFRESFSFYLSQPQFVERALWLATPGGITKLARLRFVLTGFQGEWKQGPEGGRTGYFPFPQSDSLCYSLVLDERGFPRSYGIKAKEGKTPYGEWQFWNEKGEERKEVFSKQFHLMAFDQNGNFLQECRVLIRGNGVWEKAVAYGNPSASFFLPPGADSLRVFTDSASNAIPIDYDRLPNTVGHELFLIPEGGVSFRMGYSNVPVDMQPDQYALIWNWSATPRPKPEKIMDEWKERFPGLQFWSLDGHALPMAVDLSGVSKREKETALDDLLQDHRLLKLSQVFSLPRTGLTYCDGQITLEVRGSLLQEEIAAIAARNGFELKEVANAGHPFYFLQYQNKLIGEEFFREYGEFFKSAEVMYGMMNLYERILPE